MRAMNESGINQDKFMDFYTPCPAISFEEEDIDPIQYEKLDELIDECQPVKLKAIGEKADNYRGQVDRD